MSVVRRLHPGVAIDAPDGRSAIRIRSAIFGFWIFLMSDAIIFALLMAIYGTMIDATAGGPGAGDLFRMTPAFVETLLLLTSSLTFGLASLAMKYDASARALFAWLGVTAVLGVAFLVMEWHDFAGMFAVGAYPTRSGFLSAFFALVPLHGLHVLAALLWMTVMVGQILAFGLDQRVRVNVTRLALFWHFLDVVWIAIISVVYLQGLIR